jgi:anti-anti-sigma factor
MQEEQASGREAARFIPCLERNIHMNFEYSEFEDGMRLIKLSGKLDIEGTNLVEPQFTLRCQGENAFVLVDLSQVTYLSSIGIPMLINNAKAVAKHGGRLALINPQPNVKSILDITGVLHLIRVYKDIETGRERVKQA